MRRSVTTVTGWLTTLDRVECLEKLRSRAIGRVGGVSNGRPFVLPVNYAMVGDDVLFRTAPGTKLRSAIWGARVAFEVDEVDQGSETGWSVMLIGRAEEADELLDDEGLRTALRPWAIGSREYLVRIRTMDVSGRAIVGVNEPSRFAQAAAALLSASLEDAVPRS